MKIISAVINDLVTDQRVHRSCMLMHDMGYNVTLVGRRLPDSLPAGAPLDLFSGRPFEYEKTQEGFILRCRVKEDATKTEANQYEFKIKQ